MTNAVKFKDGTTDTIEGLLAPYHGPSFLGGRDFDGEYFSAATDFELEWFGDWERPLLFGHGNDPALKTSVVGRMKVTPTDAGLWMEARLDEAHAYKDAIAALIEKEALGLSAGSIERFYHAGLDPRTGEIKHFPLIEGSLVTTPSNPVARLAYAAKSTDALSHLAVLGVTAPEQITTEPDVAVEGTAELEPPGLTAIKAALTPQSLHDAAVASGAKCASESEAVLPAPLLAVAGKSAEPDIPAIDLDALRAELTELAVKEVHTILG